VVLGIVHRDPPGAVLNARASSNLRITTLRLDDEKWRQWVETTLQACLGVIIDVSNISEGLSWELETASRLVDADRMVLLRPVGSSFTHDPVSILEYDPQNIAATSGPLLTWAKERRERFCSGTVTPADQKV
jgi:hypothetical protein